MTAELEPLARFGGKLMAVARRGRKPSDGEDEDNGVASRKSGGDGQKPGEPSTSKKLPRNRSMLILGAVALIALAVLTSPRDVSVQAKLEQGVSAYKAGRTNEARELYLEVLQRDPQNAVANFNLGVAAQEANQTSEAEKYYREALDKEPDFVAALYNYAILMEEQGKYDLSEQAYRRILERYPDQTRARINLGFLLVERLNRRDEGVEEFRKALEFDPNLISRIPPDLRPGAVPPPNPPSP